MHAIARLVLHPHITNVQTSWVKMGPRGPGVSGRRRQRSRRHADERVDHPRRRRGVRSGAAAQRIRELIEGIGRVPHQRTTVYGEVPAERVAASFCGRRPGRGGHPAAPRASAPGSASSCASVRVRARHANAIRLRRYRASRRSGPATTSRASSATRWWRGAAAAGGDVLVVTHKIVSKAEGRYVTLADITPSRRARSSRPPRARTRPGGGDPLRSREILRFRPGLIIAEHRLGVVIANAGRSLQRAGQRGRRARAAAAADPDASSAVLRDALQERFGVSLRWW